MPDDKAPSAMTRIREAQGLTRTGLARRMGIAPQKIHDYETGIRPLQRVGAGQVLKIAQALGCTVEDLLDD
ncbi:helix-turn-helix domain-containing protein [Bifidobacterium xylocopae]|uniref:HTH cro/C1-type domain-containing protein n=1 Tax=Bifidobacterium xylocopae TaxID=2493119 RepID=A0A366KAV2_9BIFI|nr:helix-turn-helix transcriptional regulator [Bifidobacterium xylocopae]RBP98824.1 hypothetical protein CRD59_06960 [Bifidobacterium xylocopae]